MPSRAPVRRKPPAERKPAKPRAWRVTDHKPPSAWQRLVVPVAGIVAAAGVASVLAFATGVFGSAGPRASASPSPLPTRPIVSSTIRGNTATPTAASLAVTPVRAVIPTFAPNSAPPLALTPGPPAQVQPVTPVTPPRASAQASASATPGGLPGTRVPASAAPSASQSIQQELRSINATATALSASVAALSASPSAGASGTPRSAPTETPIPTAAPPVVPEPQ